MRRIPLLGSFAAALKLTGASSALAQSDIYRDLRDVRRDRADIHRDQANLREEQAERNYDARREWRAIEQGNWRAARYWDTRRRHEQDDVNVIKRDLATTAVTWRETRSTSVATSGTIPIEQKRRTARMRRGLKISIGVQGMKRTLQMVSLIAVGALYVAGQTAMACTGKHCATTTIGKSTSGTGAGKIKGTKPKPALHPQPLPPGMKHQPSTNK